MMTLVCVEEVAALRQVEQERRLARMVLLAEVRKAKATTPEPATSGRRAEPVGRATNAGAQTGWAGVRRGLGHMLIATGERLAGA